MSLTIQDKSETIVLTNNPFYDKWKADGKKHFVFIPF